MSLTSSLLPLLLLSFLPSSSPLFHPCPHLTPFSSLFPPLFCCVCIATKDTAFYSTLLRLKACYRVLCDECYIFPFFPYFSCYTSEYWTAAKASFLPPPSENQRPRWVCWSLLRCPFYAYTTVLNLYVSSLFCPRFVGCSFEPCEL